MVLRPKHWEGIGCYLSLDPVPTGGDCLNIPYRGLPLSEIRDLVCTYAPTHMAIEADTDDPAIQRAIDEGWLYGQAREITVRNKSADSVITGLRILPIIKKILPTGRPLDGVTAYVIGGGPSLSRNVQGLKGRGPIIATNRAVKALDDAGIIPDVVVCAEAHPSAYTDAIETDAWKYSEIWASMGVHSSIWEDVGVWIPMPGLPFGRWYMHVTGAAGITSGGSVSTLAVSILDHLGASRIVLVGQDCALSPNREMHSGGTPYIAEGDFLANEHGEQYLRVTSDAWGGIGKVDATQQLANYRWWLESFSNKTSADLVNATEGGARIDGWTESRLCDVVDERQYIPEVGAPAKNVSAELLEDLGDMPEIISRATRLADALDELIDAGSSCHDIMHRPRSQLAAGLATGGPEETGLWVENERLAKCSAAARRLATATGEGMDLVDATIAALEES